MECTVALPPGKQWEEAPPVHSYLQTRTKGGCNNDNFDMKIATH